MLAHLEATVASSVQTRLEASPGLMASKELLREVSSRAGRDAAEAVRVAYGGGQVYIPLDKARRDAAICAAFTGDNHHELARRFHVALNTVYSILRADRIRKTEIQLSLLM
jgi:Mor family transcriptional regulator